MSTKMQNATGYDYAVEFESSMLMALYPDYIKLDRIYDVNQYFTESVRKTNKELGDKMVEKSLEYLMKAIR